MTTCFKLKYNIKLTLTNTKAIMQVIINNDFKHDEVLTKAAFI